MCRKEMHYKNLKNLEDFYLANGIDHALEFIYDGPSYWEKYENNETPRVMFLAKESHSSFHPSIPIAISGKFGINIAKWASVLLDIHQGKENKFNENLQEAYDTIAIVEVKKVDEDRTSSNYIDIKKFAELGRDYLRKQLKILEPHIIICCGTLDFFDIIYDYTPQEFLQYERVIYDNKIQNFRLKCWLSDNKLVIQFYHPSARNGTNIMLELLKDFVKNDIVQLEYLNIISKARYINSPCPNAPTSIAIS